MPVVYEWIIELVDEYDDILDVSQYNTLREALRDAAQYNIGDPLGDNTLQQVNIALTRNWSRDFEAEGLEDREYAYMDEHGNLPKYFEGTGGGIGAKVPEQFLKEARKETQGARIIRRNPATHFEKFMADAMQSAQDPANWKHGEFQYTAGNFVLNLIPVQQRTRSMRPHYREAFYILDATGRWKRTSKNEFIDAMEQT